MKKNIYVALLLGLPFFSLGLGYNKVLLKSTWRQAEVSAHSQKDLIVVGIAEKETESYNSPMRCTYVASTNGGKDWSSPLIYRNENFDFSANPTVFAGVDGSLHAVCMSVMKDYSSGILEYSKSTDGGRTWTAFSEVLKLDQGIPDKPWLAVDETGNVIITYSEIFVEPSTPQKVNSNIRVLVSHDSGKTWDKSEPATSSDYASNVANPYSGFQGSWIEKLGEQLWGLSFASYGGGDVIFCRGQQTSNLCENKVVVAQSEVQVPVTQIFKGANGLMGVLWYEAHSFSSVYLSISKNQGLNWETKIKVSGNGSMASGMFSDSNGFANILITEKSDLTVQTVRLSFQLESSVVSKIVLSEERLTAAIPYLGAYQAAIPIWNGSAGIFWVSYLGDFQTVMYSELIR